MTPGPRLPARQGALVLGLMFLWLAATAGLRPLMLPDEGRYVGVAWEMLRSGNWLTPTLNGLPYFHKPPLFYWITAASLSVWGPHEWAARAAPILGGCTGAFTMYWFNRRWCGERAARLILLALVVQPLFFLGSQFANLDMLVAGCIAATILFLADAALCIARKWPWRTSLAAGFATAAVGVLAKGLIGAVVPALVIGTWLLMSRQWRVLLSLLWWPGALIFFVIAAPWFIAMQMHFPEFFHYFFVVQHFKRFADGGFNNVQPFWFYPVVLAVFSLPWLPWLFRLLRRTEDNDATHSAIRRLMVVWVAVVVLFFSLPQSKLLGYILPAVPPLAWLMAEGFTRLGVPTLRARQLWLLCAGVTAAVSVGSVAAITVRPLQTSRAIAVPLIALRSPQEPVFMLSNYWFDMPFYARLKEPVGVIDDWSSPDIAKRDNWRKELADAGKFDTRQSAMSLISPANFATALCLARVSWVVGATAAGDRYPFLKQAAAKGTASGTTLWRVDSRLPVLSSSLGCAEMPNAGLASK